MIALRILRSALVHQLEPTLRDRIARAHAALEDAEARLEAHSAEKARAVTSALEERDIQIGRVTQLSREAADAVRQLADARVEFDLKLADYTQQITTLSDALTTLQATATDAIADMMGRARAERAEHAAREAALDLQRDEAAQQAQGYLRGLRIWRVSAIAAWVGLAVGVVAL